MSVDSKMTAIADAIRDKTGKTDTLTLDAMATEIASIEGGNQLNFTVVGGTTEPTSPTENMIWVNTNVTISSYIFSATEPEAPVYGMVWIFTSVSSTVEFNALKKNGIQVYPISAKQYIRGAWVDVEAKSYQSGEWVYWWRGELYDSGNEYTSVTGGWQARAWKLKSGYTATAPTLTKNDTYMTGVFTKKNGSGVIEIANDVDLTGYSTLYMEYTGSGLNSSYYGILGVADRTATYYKDSALATVEVVYSDGKDSAVVASLDISSINQLANVYFGMHITSSASGTNTINIHRVWME